MYIIGTMSNEDTSLDDIAEAISSLASHIDKRFEQVDKRFEQVDKRFEQVDKRFEQVDSRFNRIDKELREIRLEQRQTREWLERIDNSVKGLSSDIVEIYDRIVVLEQQVPLTQKAQQELQQHFNHLFQWAKIVAQKTGVKLPNA
jgi:chromosome segregation ATPase